MTWYLFVNPHTIIWRAHFTSAHGYHPIKIHPDDFGREIRRMATLDFDVINNSDTAAIHTVSSILKPLEHVLSKSAPKVRGGQTDWFLKDPGAYGCAIVSAEIVATLIGDPPSESPSTSDEVHPLFLLEVPILKSALSHRDIYILTRLAQESVRRTKTDFDNYLKSGEHEKSEEWDSENLEEWYGALNTLEKKLNVRTLQKRRVKKESAFQKFKDYSGSEIYDFLQRIQRIGRYLVSPHALWSLIWKGERKY